MPELPEVETIRSGLEPLLFGQVIRSVTIRQPRLRYPVPEHLEEIICNQHITALERRGKYLLVKLETGDIIVHLGMSGSLRYVTDGAEPEPHDHLDLNLERGILRYRDPRRFGLVLWHPVTAPQQHRLLLKLGPEPLGKDFSAAYLARRAAGSRRAVKNFIMDSHVVAGVGNIYANEALFLARIHPLRHAGTLSSAEWNDMQHSIVEVLRAAIKSGGTTLQDFVDSSGQPGYFQQQLLVYGRDGAPCPECGTSLCKQVIGQRSSWFCPQCQHLEQKA